MDAQELTTRSAQLKALMDVISDAACAIPDDPSTRKTQSLIELALELATEIAQACEQNQDQRPSLSAV